MFIFRRKKRPEDSPTVRLMKALKISSKDLDVNREGDISPLQKERLRKEFWTNVMVAGGLSLIPPAGLILFYRDPTPLPVMMVILCVVGLGGLYIIYQHNKNMTTGRSVAFTGRVKKYQASKQCLLIVTDYEDRDERIYKVEQYLSNAFLEGEIYTIYSPSYWLDRVIGAEQPVSQTAESMPDSEDVPVTSSEKTP